MKKKSYFRLPEVVDSLCYNNTAFTNKDLILMIQSMNHASRRLLGKLVSDMEVLLFPPTTGEINKRSFQHLVVYD